MDNNPVLNSPYSEPRWHYSTDLSGQLNYEDVRPDRRIFDSALGGYSMPFGKQKQGSLLEVNEFQAEDWNRCSCAIPFVVEGKARFYKSDFIIHHRLDGSVLIADTRNHGADKRYKAEKKFYTEIYWIPAVHSVRECYPELERVEWRFFGGEW